MGAATICNHTTTSPQGATPAGHDARPSWPDTPQNLNRPQNTRRTHPHTAPHPLHPAHATAPAPPHAKPHWPGIAHDTPSAPQAPAGVAARSLAGALRLRLPVRAPHRLLPCRSAPDSSAQ